MWFAIAADGERVLLKWFAGEGMADRYAVLLPALDVLRSHGVPVPEYPFVRATGGRSPHSRCWRDDRSRLGRRSWSTG